MSVPAIIADGIMDDDGNGAPSDMVRTQSGRLKKRPWYSRWLRFLSAAAKNQYTAVLMVLGWLAVGTIVYSLNNAGFRWSDGFYFSVQAGLSIGFGSLSETDDASRYFSCYHVIAGGLLAGTFLGSWADALAESHDSWKKAILEEDLYEQELDEALEDGVIDIKEWCRIVLRHEVVEFLDTELGVFCKATFYLVLWWIVGVLVAMYNGNAQVEKLTFAEALEFAITGLTTAGLSGLKQQLVSNATEAAEGDTWGNSLPVGNAIFCGIYCMIGVPLYGMWISKWAAVLMAEDARTATLEDAKEDFAKVDAVLAREYVEEFMPLLYPSKAEGGFLSDEQIAAKKKRIYDPDNPEMNACPALVDALLMYLIDNDKLNKETLEGFNEAWDKTAGMRQTLKLRGINPDQYEEGFEESSQPPPGMGDGNAEVIEMIRV